jgi:hypothetical protein
LNITASNITHTIQANHTITTVAAHYGPGECDLARLNLLSDPGFIYAGEMLRILVRATFPDDYSYFSANNTQTKNTCIYGGPREQSVVFQVGMQIEGCMIRFNHRKFARRLYVCTSDGRLPETWYQHQTRELFPREYSQT